MGFRRKACGRNRVIRQKRVQLYQHWQNILSLFGCGAQYKKATMDGDGNSLILQVTLPTIDSILPASTAVSWNNNTAVWDEVEGSKSYEIQL